MGCTGGTGRGEICLRRISYIQRIFHENLIRFVLDNLKLSELIMGNTKNFVTPLKQPKQEIIPPRLPAVRPGPPSVPPGPSDVPPWPSDVPPRPPAVLPGPPVVLPSPSLAPMSKHRILAKKAETVAAPFTVQKSVSGQTPVHLETSVSGNQAGPKKPCSPFLMFIRKERQKLVKLGLTEDELHKKLMQNWININPVLKQKLESLYAKNKEKYGINLSKFEQKKIHAAAKISQSTSAKKGEKFFI